MGATVVGTAGTKDGMDVVVKCGAHQVHLFLTCIVLAIYDLRQPSMDKLQLTGRNLGPIL
jgi:hypothetical protein